MSTRWWLLIDHGVLRNWDRILVRSVKGLISRAGMVSICPLLWQRDVKLQQTGLVFRGHLLTTMLSKGQVFSGHLTNTMLSRGLVFRGHLTVQPQFYLHAWSSGGILQLQCYLQAWCSLAVAWLIGFHQITERLLVRTLGESTTTGLFPIHTCL